MFTIKYTDQDGMERLASGTDFRANMSGRQAETVSWLDSVSGQGCAINFPTTVYVMSESGATVGKYVTIGNMAPSEALQYAITPEGVFEPATEVYYAYGLEAAVKLAAEKFDQTGRGWHIFARVSDQPAR